jgi:hypothetical protein
MTKGFQSTQSLDASFRSLLTMAATSLDKSMRKHTAGVVHAGDAGNAAACDAADNIDDLQVYSL